MNHPIHNYVRTHRDIHLPSKEDDYDTMFNVVLQEAFVSKDPSKVLFRISVNGPVNLRKDLLVKYNLRDLFLGDLLKEVDWLPTPLSISHLLDKGFDYV